MLHLKVLPNVQNHVLMSVGGVKEVPPQVNRARQYARPERRDEKEKSMTICMEMCASICI